MLRAFLILPLFLLLGGVAQATDKLNVAFLGGFKDEKVEIFVGDRKVYSSKLTTNPLLGGAGGMGNIALTAKLSISVPRLSLKQEVNLTPNGGNYLWVVLNQNKLEFEQRKTPAPLE